MVFFGWLMNGQPIFMFLFRGKYAILIASIELERRVKAMFGRMWGQDHGGGSDREDFRKEDLPKTRWQLFRLTFRTRFSGLCRLNLMTALAWVPLLLLIGYCLVCLFNVLVIDSQYAAYLQTGDPGHLSAAQIGQWAQAEDTRQLVADISLDILSGFCLWCIPCLLILGPVQAGLADVTGHWARDEHAFPWSDFKDALLAHWKQALGVSAVTSVTPLILLICWRFYGQQAQDSVIFLIPQMLILSLGIVWFLGLVYLYPMVVTYHLSFGQAVKNSLLLALGRLPQTVGIRLLTLLPTLLSALIFLFTGSLLPFLFLGGYYLLIGNALARFLFASCANAAFDRFINGGTKGAPVRTEEEREDASSPPRA